MPVNLKTLKGNVMKAIALNESSKLVARWILFFLFASLIEGIAKNVGLLPKEVIVSIWKVNMPVPIREIVAFGIGALDKYVYVNKKLFLRTQRKDIKFSFWKGLSPI